MKKSIALLLSLVMLLLASCGSAQTTAPDTEATTVGTEASSTTTTTDTTETSSTDATQETTELTSEQTSETTASTTTEATSETTTAPATEPTTEPTTVTTTEPTSSSTDGAESTTQPSETETTTAPPEPVTLNIKKSSINLFLGCSETLSYEYTGSKALSWKSSNEKVATVSNGKVTAKSAGSATITVTDGTRSDTCQVTVTNYEMHLYQLSLELKTGESATLSYINNGPNAVSWKSSNETVVTVDKNGKVTAKCEGYATITLTDGFKYSQCQVTVKGTSLVLEQTSITLEVGKSTTLKYIYTGNKSLTWKTNNSSVATVSNGTVKAIAAGTATITVTDGKLSATCVVSVTAPPSAETFTMHTPDDTVVYVGQALQLDFTYTGDKSKLVFESSGGLTVTNSGLATGVSPGRVHVTVWNGLTCLGGVRILVKDANAPVATRIDLASTTGPYFNGTFGVVGNYMQFTAFAITSVANNPQAVTASSSNSGVATVSLLSNSGSNRCTFKVSFKAAGSTTITITSEDGNVSAYYELNVKSGYACNPGKSQLTPEEWARCQTQVMVENGLKSSTGLGGYLVYTCTDADLTWASARSGGEYLVSNWWNSGIRYCYVSYQGRNEDGLHVFYQYRG